MRYNIEDVMSGKLDGKTVWACDYRFNDPSEKPIRHLKPTYSLVRPNSEAPGKSFYYSESHLVALKNGEPQKSKLIPVVDNTGFRSRSGHPIAIFDNEAECREFYKKQCNVILSQLREWKDKMLARYDELVAVIKSEM